jgi:hyperosmotically inducible periplasmic protein
MIDGDRVTLLGQVVTPTLKSDAANSVKSIEGVSAVDNQIEVLPFSPNDEQIRQAEFRAIYSAPGMEKYSIQAVPPIDIIVKTDT